MNYFFEPVNLNMWNLFDKVSEVGHIECFYATNSMNIGDIMFLHVGSQDSDVVSGIYAVGEIVSKPYILRDSPEDYCNNKNTVDVKIIKYSQFVPLITHKECFKYINHFRSHHMLEREKGKILYDLIMNIEIENEIVFLDDVLNVNKKRISSKKDWIDILKNEEQENNVILEILFYMLGCVDYTSNGLNIQKALNLNGIPNFEVVGFGKRIVKLKQIEEQDNGNGGFRYWNIPFETVKEKNTFSIFTWKLRKELVEALVEYYDLSISVNNLDEALEEFQEMLPEDEYNSRIENEIELRKEFVKRFNINYLMNMDLEDYVTGRSTIDDRGKNSFCYLIESRMRQLGDMRGATADKFGIYYSKDNVYDFTNKYGLTVEDAFSKIKEELCKLIIAGNNEDYESMSKSLISPLFKGKILSTYFPEKYLCIFKEEDIDKFLYSLNINYDVSEVNTLEKKKRLLKKYKDDSKLFVGMSDYYFMRFLYNTFKKELKEKNTVSGMIDTNIELVDFKYIGAHLTERKNTYRSRETDYEKINRNKKDIGNRGEKAVLQYEKNNLINLGSPELAEKVELTENDAIGYDIISYDISGNEKHIEVKTNSSSSNNIMDFYLTANELEKMYSDPTYNIYYLYSIKNKPKLHIVNKNILLEKQSLYLNPVLYKISVDVEIDREVI